MVDASSEDEEHKDAVMTPQKAVDAEPAQVKYDKATSLGYRRENVDNKLKEDEATVAAHRSRRTTKPPRSARRRRRR